MNDPPAKLILEDGEIFCGHSIGHHSSGAGEVVFNTGMTGYPQALTDPSYSGQILCFTYPLLGNYGVPEKTLLESDRVQVKGVIVSEYASDHNHWEAQKSFHDWLKEEKIPCISGIDTRRLTSVIREKGVMLGKIIIDEEIGFYDPNRENLVKGVSRQKPSTVGNGRYKVVVVDCGAKQNIIRCLLKRDVTLTVVPWDYDFTREHYDGLFISNGPGDPTMCVKTINHLKKALLKKKPIFGICLGNQLLGLAAGAKTYKLKYGHRSQNQPCVGRDDKGYITSQNHGYAIDAKTLPDGWEEYFHNANDGTNEGIRHKSLPFFSVQFHPEGSAGPKDTEFLFDDFIEMMQGGRDDRSRRGL